MAEKPWVSLIWDGLTLRPRSAFDLSLISERYSIGSYLRAQFSKDRSVQHLRLYWSVLREVVEATDMWMSSEDLHEAIKLELRMVRGVTMINGRTRFLTRSIDFDSMDQGEFALFFKKAMLAIEEATGIDTDELIARAKLKCHYQEAA